MGSGKIARAFARHSDRYIMDEIHTSDQVMPMRKIRYYSVAVK